MKSGYSEMSYGMQWHLCILTMPPSKCHGEEDSAVVAIVPNILGTCILEFKKDSDLLFFSFFATPICAFFFHPAWVCSTR